MRLRGRGHQAVFRFYADYPNKPTAIPKFLLDAGLKTFPYDDSNNKVSVSPDYSDPRLIKAFTDFYLRRFGGEVMMGIRGLGF